jgi:hypothetical protein
LVVKKQTSPRAQLHVTCAFPSFPRLSVIPAPFRRSRAFPSFLRRQETSAKHIQQPNNFSTAPTSPPQNPHNLFAPTGRTNVATGEASRSKRNPWNKQRTQTAPKGWTRQRNPPNLCTFTLSINS